jgi:rfaE bifunctional protein kinase chain/domain
LSIKVLINQLFSDFSRLNVLIVGDVMIDTYFNGKVDRISPEAPVPIVSVHHEEHRLGGAANVALNVRALEANPFICSVIGSDEKGKTFIELCKMEGVDTEGIIESKDRITTVKTRVIGNNHQLLRVDTEDLSILNDDLSDQLIKLTKKIIANNKIDVIIFEDYDKGVITEKLIKEVVAEANKHKIPTSVDPKKNNFLNYHSVSLFKPNLKELKEGTKIDFERSTESNFNKAIDKLKNELNAGMIFVTLSDEGVYLKSDKDEVRIPAHLRDIADVSGAGDTVISVASLCLALDQDEHMIAFLSNLAGGLVCEKVGVVPIDKSMLLQEAISSITVD